MDQVDRISGPRLGWEGDWGGYSIVLRIQKLERTLSLFCYGLKITHVSNLLL
jgi:hypothetical protein